MTWSLKHIESLKQQGKIRDYKVLEPSKANDPKTGGRIVSKHFKKRSKEKDWIARELLTWCQDRSLKLEEEFRFHQEKRWRFDWCVPDLKIAVEYEGIMSSKSRHTTKKGFTGDKDKYNAAAGMGWKVLCFTVLNYKNLLTELKNCL